MEWQVWRVVDGHASSEADQKEAEARVTKHVER